MPIVYASGIPARIKRDIDSYVKSRLQPGGFVRAVLCNDLQRAVLHGDEDNLAFLVEITKYVRWTVPAVACGSEAAVSAWLAGDDRDHNDEEGHP